MTASTTSRHPISRIVVYSTLAPVPIACGESPTRIEGAEIAA